VSGAGANRTRHVSITPSIRDARPSAHSGPGRPSAPRIDWRWPVAAILIALVAATTMRLGTGIAERSTRWDERYMRVPIDDLIRDGWSVRTAIDFSETKGPAFVWPYAIMGKVLGGTLGDLRLISMFWLLLGVLPLLAIAMRCGVRGPPLIAVTMLYLLLPQQAVLGQLLMSEPIFVTGTLTLVWTAIVGLSATGAGTAERRRRIVAVIAFGALVAILMHLRIHVVATAGAVCVVALLRLGIGAWPWWLAAFVGGLLRIPLWIRWGGLVSPDYQYMHQIGGDAADALLWFLHPANVVYLTAALAPMLALLGIAGLRSRRCRLPVVVGALVALVAALLFPPSMSARLALPEVVAEGAPRGELERYLGLAATLARSVDAVWMQTSIIAILAILGGAGLGALWINPRRLRATRETTAPRDVQRMVTSLTFWTLLGGIALYALTDAFVVDRYLLPWAALLPIIWWRRLPRLLLAAQILGLTLLLGGWTRSWLLR